jgi:citrate lyase subunit beta/citryl-CoA lyase
VYPTQIAAIHEELTPSAQQVVLARATVENFEAERRGEAPSGPAIESPDYHTARRLLARDLEFKTWLL